METRIAFMTEGQPNEAALEEAAGILKKGGLVAFPTETVYGLGGNAFDPDAARKIYAAKGRPCDNPLIVHIAREEDLYRIAKSVPEEAKILAKELWPGPLTMILEKTEELPKETTGGLDTVAVRFPSNGIAAELIRRSGGFIAAPSANLSGRPSTTKGEHVIRDMNGRIDMILSSDDSTIGLESTIVDLTVDPPAILRPGYYTANRIRRILKKPVVTPLGMKDPEAAPKAPGMKYRHYAPKADLVIVEGENVPERILRLVGKEKESGRKTAILCSDETKPFYRGERVFSLGLEEEEIARSLFDVLRQTDEAGVDIIFSEAFETPQLGRAIMNRLEKAAGGKIIKGEKK